MPLTRSQSARGQLQPDLWAAIFQQGEEFSVQDPAKSSSLGTSEEEQSESEEGEQQANTKGQISVQDLPWETKRRS